MSREWPLWILVALGHLGILVYLTNVVHAFGLTDRGMRRVKRLVLLGVLAISGALAIDASRGGWGEWSWPVRVYSAACLGVVLVGIPVSSLRRMVRRDPPGITERTETVDLAGTDGPGSLIGNGAHAWLLKLPGNESFRLRKREWDVALPGLPAAWDGLSLVHLTDLHFAPCFERRYFERVADEATAWDADLVVFTGDLIDHDDALDWIVPILSRVRGKVATLAILGNHDYDHHPLRIRQLLEEAGFRDLEGRWDRIEVRGRTLAVGGTSSPWGPAIDLGAGRDADFRLLLSHTPDLLYRAADAGIDLMLSGHNHGGQVRLPGLGPVFMPSKYSRRFDRGYFRAGPTLLHVGQGVAGKHPIRIGCVPEIGRLVLRAPRDASLAPSAIRPGRVHDDPAHGHHGERRSGTVSSRPGGGGG